MWTKDYYQHENIYCIPSVHGSIDFAALTRKVFFDIKPDCIAVELPEFLRAKLIEAVERLPYLSVLSFLDQTINNTEHYSYVPIQPGDSIIEAVRLAVEFDIELFLIDRDIEGLIAPPVHPPDCYFVTKSNLKSYYEQYSKLLSLSAENDPHYLRELDMANQLKKLSKIYDRVFFVSGIYHHNRISNFLKTETKQLPLVDNKRDEVYLENLSNNLYHDLLGTMPFQNYLYELSRKGLTSFEAELDIPPEENHKPEDKIKIKEFHRNMNLLVERLKQMTSVSESVDQYSMLHEIFIKSKRLYYREWDDLLAAGKLSIALKYARNYAIVNKRLVPNPFQLITASKNTLNDDFAWELARILQFYPFNNNYDSIKDFSLDQKENFYKNYFSIEPWILSPIPLKKRPKEENPGDWNKAWNNGYDLVSYPAEDLIIENYFNYLRKKGKSILEEEHSRTVPFETSIKDGIDIKETLRNLHLNKIYVKEQLPIKGDIGSVVIIFDEKDIHNKYNFKMTWYAEHQNESDLALYSTPPGEKLVGPGISRAEYGGLLSIYPPRHIPNVWSDHRFDRAKTKAERLLLAGILHSEKKYIVYVAENLPASSTISIAERYNKHILFIPIFQLSDLTIKKIRFFHFLADRRLRSIASKYIR